MPTFSLTDSTFWLRFVYYFLTVFVAFYIPGSLFLRRISAPKVFRIALSIALGLALFACQGYVFGLLHVRFLTPVYLFVCFGMWLFLGRKKSAPKYPGKYKISKVSWAIIIIGSFMQLSTIWFTGVIFKGTAYYCCGNTIDNFFYGSLSNKLLYSVPPEHPGLTGEIFYNYHYWSNIVVAETSRIFGLPVFQTQFQYSTLLIAVTVGILLASFVWFIGGSKSLELWTLFFFYFGSDAIYWLIALVKSAPMFSMSSLEDGPGFLANYPRAMAVLVGMAAVSLLFYVRKKPTKIVIIATSLLFASILGMKIYIAFFMYVGLLCLAVFDVIKNKSKTSMAIGILTSIFVLPVYLQTNAGAGGLYFLGFWRAQNFIVQPWLNLLRLEQARIIYEADNKWIQVSCFNILFTFIYVAAIFGTKILAFLNTKRTLRQVPSAVHVFLLPSLVVSFILGFFFNQESGESNTFNFLVSVFLFSSLYSALVMSYISDKKRNIIITICIIVVIILTIPRPLYRTYRNIANIFSNQGFKISGNILYASQIVRSNTKSTDIFLVNPKFFKFDNEGPVFSILFDRPMFYSGESVFTMVKAAPSEVARRKLVSSKVFGSENIIEIAAQLKYNQITYLIDGPEVISESTQSASFLEAIYENPEIRIRKINRQAIPDSVNNDFIESTQSSEIRFNELTFPYRVHPVKVEEIRY